MKNIKFLLFITSLLFFLNVIFFNCSLATLYIIKDQEGNNICITNQENLIFEYEKLGYIIWILETGVLSQKSLEPEYILKEPQSQLEPESIDSEPQTKAVLPPTTGLMPALETNIDREKMIDIFKTNALKEWGNDSRMVNFEVKKQTEAYDWYIKQTKYPDIIERAKQEWANDYAMAKYEYEKQSEAYNWINQQKAYPEIMKKAKQEWGVDYVMVKYEYEKQVEAYEWLQKNKNRNPEAFNRASNKWGNDYVMVKYELENF
jgi:hypothetical protein